MFGLPLNTVLAIGVVVFGLGLFAYLNRDKFPAIKLPWASKPDPKAELKAKRKAALSAFDDAVGYLEAAGCEAGVKLMQQALPHFYDDGSHS